MVIFGPLELIRQECPKVRPAAHNLSAFQNRNDFSSTIPKVTGVLRVAEGPATKMKLLFLTRNSTCALDRSRSGGLFTIEVWMPYSLRPNALMPLAEERISLYSPGNSMP